MMIRLFGAFRNLQSEPELSVDVPASVETIGQLREALAQHFSHSNLTQGFDTVGLLAKSAIANDREVLQDAAVFTSSDRLALLPPVSGG